MKRCTLPLLLVAGLFTVSLGGCVVSHRSSVTVHSSSYNPPSYRGQIVYFTSKGGPYICHAQYRERLPDSLRSRYATYWHNHRSAYERWYRSHPAMCAGGPWHAPATGSRAYQGGSRSHPRGSKGTGSRGSGSRGKSHPRR